MEFVATFGFLLVDRRIKQGNQAQELQAIFVGLFFADLGSEMLFVDLSELLDLFIRQQHGYSEYRRFLRAFRWSKNDLALTSS